MLQSRPPSAPPAFAPPSHTPQPRVLVLDQLPPLPPPVHVEGVDIVISRIPGSDTVQSIGALKKIQKVLRVNAEEGTQDLPTFLDLSNHADALIRTITLQLAHVFVRPEDIILPNNFRLAKHLIQTLYDVCNHALLAESLTVETLTLLLEQLTLRLVQTEEFRVIKVKDLSRFINATTRRFFETAHRVTVFRSLFSLLLQIVQPFPTYGTTADSHEAKVAALVLKSIWKLSRTIPTNLEEGTLDPIELFPTLEQFLQPIPLADWRARATNQVPLGDAPLRLVKVIIRHIVEHFGENVHDKISSAFDDPSATIINIYVSRILNPGPISASTPKPLHVDASQSDLIQ